MRAIRRVIGAWRKISEHPTAAYTDLVAALESLADKAQHVPSPTWDNVDYPQTQGSRPRARRPERAETQRDPRSGD